jgi:hypothetical protein
VQRPPCTSRVLARILSIHTVIQRTMTTAPPNGTACLSDSGESSAERRRRATQLGRQITELAGHLNAAQYRFLVLVEQHDREGCWIDDGGAVSCAHWLNWKCGIDLGAAREKVRVAHALAALPAISAAMAAGELSYSKVRALTRVATADTEGALLRMARNGTAVDVERIVRGYRRAQEVLEVGREAAQFAARTVHWYHDDDGSLVLKACLPAEAGAVLVKALEAAAPDGRLRHREADVPAEASSSKPPADGRSAASQSRADALVAMAEGFLAGQASTLGSGARRQIVVHVDAATLLRREGGRCELEAGPSIAVETARRLGCDASRLTIIENQRGEPLDVGRRTRTIPPAIYRALRARDKGCRFPGCTHSRFVDGHHIRHWADGGATRLSNLVLLCRFHHRQVHEGGVRVTRLDDGALRFTRTDDGQVLERAPRTRGNLEALRSIHARQGLAITPSTARAVRSPGGSALPGHGYP